jgi:hypothetical protein
MNAFQLLVASALLTTPTEELHLGDVSALHASWAPAIRVVALHWELLDARETHFLLANEQDFDADLKVLHERYTDLRSAPPLAESKRFPTRDVINDLLSFNRAYRHDLNERLAIDQIHGEELRAALAETDQLYRVWDTVRDAKCDYYYVYVRRRALQQLREQVGETAFYTGQLPPYVPIWRFPGSE